MRMPLPVTPAMEARESILDGIATQRAMIADIAKENSPIGENPDGTFKYRPRTMVVDPFDGSRITLEECYGRYTTTLAVLCEVHSREFPEPVLGNTGHAALLHEQRGRIAMADAEHARLLDRIRRDNGPAGA